MSLKAGDRNTELSLPFFLVSQAFQNPFSGCRRPFPGEGAPTSRSQRCSTSFSSFSSSSSRTASGTAPGGRCGALTAFGQKYFFQIFFFLTLFPVGYLFGEGGRGGAGGRVGGRGRVLEQRKLVCRVVSFILSLGCVVQGGHSPPFCLCSREQLGASPPHLFVGVEPFACVLLVYCCFR